MSHKYFMVNTFSGDLTLGNSSPRHIPFGNTISKTLSFTESETYVKTNKNFTLEKLGIKVTANTRTSGTGTCMFRVNAANTSCFANIPFATTGWFYSDATGSVAVAADSTCNFQVTYGSGGSGSISYNSLIAAVDQTGSLMNNYFTNASTTIAYGSANRYSDLIGASMNNPNEAQTQQFITDLDLKVHSCIANSVRDGDSTAVVRSDGTDTANSLTINNLQYYENIINTVSFDNELFSYRVEIGGTTGQLRLATHSAIFEGNHSLIISAASTGLSFNNNSFYGMLGGNLVLNSTDSTQSQLPLLINNQRCRKILANVSTNTNSSYPTYIILQKNGVDTDISLEIGGGLTGQFSSDVNTEDFVEADLVNFRLTTVGAGSLTFRSVSTEWLTLTPAPSNPTYLNFFKLIGGF